LPPDGMFAGLGGGGEAEYRPPARSKI
jgi:hypothetical protein